MSPAARDSSSDFRALPTASIPLALAPTSRAHADRSERNGGNDLAQAHDRAADEERAACRADQSTDEQNDGEQDRVPDAPVRPCLRRFHFVMVGRLRWRSITLATSRRSLVTPERIGRSSVPERRSQCARSVFECSFEGRECAVDLILHVALPLSDQHHGVLDRKLTDTTSKPLARRPTPLEGLGHNGSSPLRSK